MAYVVVDIETTGLSRYYHKITEIAAVRIRNGNAVEEFQTFVNPQTKIPSFITRLTGIDNEMVQDAPVIENALPDFLSFLKDDLFVAHNAAFDFGFLDYNARRTNTRITNSRLCTRRLARKLLPQCPSKKLSALCTHLNIVNHQAHRAMGDARATAELLSAFLRMLQSQGICKEEDVLKFQSRSQAIYSNESRRKL